jgi:RNA-directed DNA polymerase
METFEQLLYQLHLSYLQARKNKRNTHNQLAFELNQETNLYALAKAIYKQKYTPKPCIAFIIQKPVMREIFAADFTDRVIHHFIYRCIYPIIDSKLIHDTYSCRVGKGTLFGINRAKGFMRSCSQDFTKDTYFLKLDIEAYFMNMNHDILFEKVLSMLPKNKINFLGISRETLIYLIRQTIFNNVTENCRIKGNKSDWLGLPPSKSLFNYPNNTGLPIGNLTSQVFGNVYMNDFDYFVKKELKLSYYGRYVDDMLFFHNEKSFLESIIPQLSNFLLSHLKLKVHPNKIVLKSIDEGIPFLGLIIKPHCSYVGNRTKNNFYSAIQEINKIMAVVPQFTWQQLCDIRATLNSYLGYMQHANSFNLRKAMLGKLIKRFYNFYFVEKNFKKVIINEDFWQWHFSPNYQFTN